MHGSTPAALLRQFISLRWVRGFVLQTLLGLFSLLIMAAPAWAATATISAKPTPTSPYTKQPFTMDVTVAKTSILVLGVPSGTVTVTEVSAGLTRPVGAFALSSGKAAIPLVSTSSGSKTIKLTYSGDSKFSAIASPQSFSVTIKAQTSTSTALSVTPATISAGQSATLVATVTGSSPTGKVSFRDQNGAIGTADVISGKATLVKAFANAGSYTLTAVYEGNTANAPSPASAPKTLTVNRVATNTTLAPLSSQVLAGQSVTFTASVSGNAPTGTVRFVDGAGATLGDVPLASGNASFTKTFAAAGSYSVKANYLGDANNNASASAVASVSVKASASTDLSVSPNPAYVDQPVTLQASVSGSSPTGTVTFFEQGASIGTAPLSGGVAKLTRTYAAAGNRTLTARYEGDGLNAVSPVSAPRTLEVKAKVATVTSLQSSVAGPLAGQTVNFIAQVTGSAPSGVVRFVDGGGAVLSDVPLANGRATLAWAFQSAGSYSVTAHYLGDVANAASSSAPLAVAVKALSSTQISASPSPAYLGEEVTLAADVTGNAPGGVVEFYQGATLLGSSPISNGRAVLTQTFDAVQTLTLTAKYTGDTRNSSSTSPPASLVVKGPGVSYTTLSVSSSTVKLGQAVSARVKVSGDRPTGTVAVMNGVTLLGQGVPNEAGEVVVRFVPDPSLSYNLRAIFNGDARNMPSSSSDVTVTVGGGRAYFFDSAAGRGQQGTELLPWTSLSMLAGLTLGENDRVFLKCGSVWRETLNIDYTNVVGGGKDAENNAIQGQTINIGAYGDDCDVNKPRISGADPLVDAARWSKVSGVAGEVYEYTFPAESAAPDVRQVFLKTGAESAQLQVARYPAQGFLKVVPSAYNPDNKGITDRIVHSSVSTSAADYQEIIRRGGAQAFDGALLHIRTDHYRFEERSIKSYSTFSDDFEAGATRIKLRFGIHPKDPSLVEDRQCDSNGKNCVPVYDEDAFLIGRHTGLPIKRGFGYVLSGKFWMLSGPGQWAYDKAQRKLRVWFPEGSNPSNAVVEASVRDFGITVRGATVNLEGLAVERAGLDGVSLEASQQSVVSGLTVSRSGRDGIAVNTLNNAWIYAGVAPIRSMDVELVRNVVSFSRRSGIRAFQSIGTQVIDNVVEDSGTYLEPSESDCGICTTGSPEWGGGWSRVQGNTVRRTALNGIMFQALHDDRPGVNQQTLIEGNTVEDACMRLEDCGAIYTVTGESEEVFFGLADAQVHQGATVRNNVTMRAWGGDGAGLPDQPTARLPVLTAGIYLDDRSRNITVEGNVVADADVGIFLHDLNEMRVLNNSMNMARRVCLLMGDNTWNAPQSDVTVSGNKCVAGGQGRQGDYDSPAELVRGPALGVQIMSLYIEPWANFETGQSRPWNSFEASGLKFSNNSYEGVYGPVAFEVTSVTRKVEDALSKPPKYKDEYLTRVFSRDRWYGYFPQDPANGESQATDRRVPLLRTFNVATTTGPDLINSNFNDGTAAQWQPWSEITVYDAAVCGGGSGCAGRRPVDDPAFGKSGSTLSHLFPMQNERTYHLKLRFKTPETGLLPVAVSLQCEGHYSAPAGVGAAALPADANYWTSFEVPVRGGRLERCPSDTAGQYFARIEFNGLKPMLFDDVVLTPATFDFNDGTSNHRVMINGSASARSQWECPDKDANGGADPVRCSQYVTTDRQPVDWGNLPVEPYGAKVLIWTGAAPGKRPFYNTTP